MTSKQYRKTEVTSRLYHVVYEHYHYQFVNVP